MITTKGHNFSYFMYNKSVCSFCDPIVYYQKLVHRLLVVVAISKQMKKAFRTTNFTL